MQVAQQFAQVNRAMMARNLLRQLTGGYDFFDSLEREERVESVHNYIDLDAGITRKGAISAREGERVVVPFNMAVGAIIGRGRGNEAYNFSAPHGAGRLLSRSKALKGA
eukprot:gnl/Ergobibamus_cyprinoides/1959.p2 GENE.gnl/Ergobibamus_cyprinoides/1959~~gnl/Ergobibamus_cyprinoides/1959.p2  ORF type:complete len:109 (-),score=33.24 gnl/Ergobibamus_cyprinoides/1959:279-605(-)